MGEISITELSASMVLGKSLGFPIPESSKYTFNEDGGFNIHLHKDIKYVVEGDGDAYFKIADDSAACKVFGEDFCSSIQAQYAKRFDPDRVAKMKQLIKLSAKIENK